MQYIFLRGIIESTLSNFICPHCGGKAVEQSLFLTGMTSQGVDINIHCPGCQSHTLLHAEINAVANEMMASEHGKQFLKEYLEKGGTLGANMTPGGTIQNTNSDSIKDEDITEMYKNLKNAHSVEDIMGTNE